MRYYEQRYPEVDELVMVQVRQIAEMGAYVKLLEYDNIEGMILLSELSRRRIRSIQKLIRVGRNEVVVVLRVDKEKGYIDLSKRRVSPEDIVKCEERYMKSKTVSSILRHVATKLPSNVSTSPTIATAPSSEAPISTPANPDPALANDPAPAEPDVKESKRARRQRAHAEAQENAPALDGAAAAEVAADEEARLEHIYETIGWPLAKAYGHPYDAFKLALTEPETVWSKLPSPVPESTLSLLTTTIAKRLTPQPIKLRADIELTCYTPAGIDAIKKALRAGERASSEQVPIKAKLVAPPLYVLTTNATDKFAAVDRLERSIEAIQSKIESQGGNLVVKMKPKAVSETEDNDLAALMAKAAMENQEVSGDEDDEEGI
jgi:translation initiation factor 2 subunit 1